MFKSLLAEPGVEEVCELRSSCVGFLALHGGNQDRETDVIARLAADSCDASLYAVIQPPTLRWHLPSYRYDPAQSRNLAQFLDHVDVVISVHGYGRDAWWWDWVPPRDTWPEDRAEMWERFWYPTSFLLGGRNRALAGVVAGALRKRIPDHPVIDDLDRIPRGARGMDPRNPVNLTRGGGCQVEVPPGPRGLDGDRPQVPELVEALTAAARSVSEAAQSFGSTCSP